MTFTKLFLFILGIVFLVFIASCSNNGQDLKQNQEEKIVRTDKELFLKINGEIDEIYSFIPNTTNPLTNKTLTDDEIRNNNIMLPPNNWTRS